MCHCEGIVVNFYSLSLSLSLVFCCFSVIPRTVKTDNNNVRFVWVDGRLPLSWNGERAHHHFDGTKFSQTPLAHPKPVRDYQTRLEDSLPHNTSVCHYLCSIRNDFWVKQHLYSLTYIVIVHVECSTIG
jgi:hypothetical protein